MPLQGSLAIVVLFCILNEFVCGGGGGGKTKHVAPNYPLQFNSTIYLNDQPYRGGVWYDKLANRAAGIFIYYLTDPSGIPDLVSPCQRCIMTSSHQMGISCVQTR